MEIPAAAATEIAPGPDPHPRPPARYPVPAGAVDTHAHLVGHHFVEDRSYTPRPAPLEDYLRMLDATGMTYGVLVQVSVHGSDNSLMLHALADRPDRLRGVAVLPPDVTDTTLAAMAEGGVVGLRLNTVAGGGFGFDRIDRYEAICAEMGWHLQLLTDPRHLAPVAGRLARLTVPYVIDHMGDFAVADGLDDPGWRLTLELVREGAWTKLSGAFRITGPPYRDTVPFARALVEAAPDRCVWGSDWPQVGFWGPMPNNGALLDLLADWAPDPAVRDGILTTNAHRLYGFDRR